MPDFKSLGLSPELLQSIQTLGYEKPTAIQAEVIPYILANPLGDIVALAQTGTGKTAAFGLPLGDLVDWKSNDTQALILSPTRELAVQITGDLKGFYANVRGANVLAVYGGAGIYDQIKGLRRGAQVVVATPGRLMDLINRKAIDLSTVRIVVLDEADEMLNMGFRDDIEEILRSVPEERAVWLYSATMPKAIEQIAKRYMREPAKFSAGKQNTAAANLAHNYYLVDGRQRYPVLKRTLDFFPDIYAIVFCQTKIETRKIAEHLEHDGYRAEALHGDLSQGQRETVMAKFRNKTISILIATDVAARGIDVDNVTHVIHFSLPDDFEAYTHRSGRTARAGKSGQAIALVTQKERYKVKQIEKSLNIQMKLIDVPSADDVLKTQMVKLAERVNAVTISPETMSSIEKFQLDQIEPMQVWAYLLSKEIAAPEKLMSGGDFNHREDSRDSRPSRDKREGRSSGGSDFHEERGSGRYTSVYVGLGQKDQMNAARILKLTCDKAGIAKNLVGKIKLFHDHAVVDIDETKANEAIDKLRGATWDNKGFRVKLMNERKR